MIDISNYVTKFFYPEVRDRITITNEQTGFWVEPIMCNRVLYILNVPKTKLTFLTKLTLRHEIGHIKFHEMAIRGEYEKIESVLSKIKKHKIFCWLQKIWYWNKFIRAIKTKLGFCGDLQYKYDDNYGIYYDTETIVTPFTRGENELYCDWYALHG